MPLCPSNRFAFVIRYLNHAAPRMQEPRAYARVAPLRERILRPCIWPSWESHPSEDHSEAPSFVATAHIIRVDFAGSFPPNGEKPACFATPPLPIKPFDSAGSPSMLQRSTSGLDASIFNASACHGLRCGCAAPTESGAPIRRPAHSACRFPDSRRKVKNAAVRFSCQRTLVLPKGQRTRGKGACLSRLYRNKNQISRGLSIKLFPKGLEFFSGELKRFFDAVLGNAFLFAISFAVRFSA